MAALFLKGTKLCDVLNLQMHPGKQIRERAGGELIPGRKEADSVTFACGEPILPEPMYDLHLDDGQVLRIVITNTSGTATGTSVKAFVQP